MNLIRVISTHSNGAGGTGWILSCFGYRTKQGHSVVLATDLANWAQDCRHGNEVTP